MNDRQFYGAIGAILVGIGYLANFQWRNTQIANHEREFLAIQAAQQVVNNDIVRAFQKFEYLKINTLPYALSMNQEQATAVSNQINTYYVGLLTDIKTKESLDKKLNDAEKIQKNLNRKRLLIF